MNSSFKSGSRLILSVLSKLFLLVNSLDVYMLFNDLVSCCNGKVGLMVRVFPNGPGNMGSIPGQVTPKTQKMVLDAALLNTQHYKVRLKDKVEQSNER